VLCILPSDLGGCIEIIWNKGIKSRISSRILDEALICSLSLLFPEMPARFVLGQPALQVLQPEFPILVSPRVPFQFSGPPGRTAKIARTR